MFIFTQALKMRVLILFHMTAFETPGVYCSLRRPGMIFTQDILEFLLKTSWNLY